MKKVLLAACLALAIIPAHAQVGGGLVYHNRNVTAVIPFNIFQQQYQPRYTVVERPVYTPSTVYVDPVQAAYERGVRDRMRQEELRQRIQENEERRRLEREAYQRGYESR